MEHRHDFRLDVSHCVTVVKNQCDLGCFDVTNIGYGGALVSPHSQSQSLAQGDIVHVIGCIPDEHKVEKYELNAMVVYVNSDGVGLTWIESEAHIYAALTHVVANAA